jgi:hypothetical protein
MKTFIGKKMFFIASLLLTLGMSVSANTVSEVSQLNDYHEIAYSFDLGDITDVSEESLEKIVDEFLSTISYPSDLDQLDCSVSVTGSVSIPGVANIEISVTVSGSCDEMAEVGTQIAKRILQDVKSALTNR